MWVAHIIGVISRAECAFCLDVHQKKGNCEEEGKCKGFFLCLPTTWQNARSVPLLE